MSLFATTARLGLIARLVREGFPGVDAELACWKKAAAATLSPELADQALASIRDKRFHCLGGSVFSLYPGVDTPAAIRLIVALQTISDYLDNLCDRAGICDETAFRQLHLAFIDALDPHTPPRDYYGAYPYRGDNGYLGSLVETCRAEIAKLPAYDLVKPSVIRLATLYADLQTYKHLDPAIRHSKMTGWAATHLAAHPGLTAWEFAAASGSTLGIFMLFAAAADRSLTPDAVQDILAAYFPWIAGFHILLDYLIDLDEDRRHGDLNFVAYYRDPAEIYSRLSLFYREALQHTRRLANPLFAETVISGLLAMYLSDPKSDLPVVREVKRGLLDAAGGQTRLLHSLCRLLRTKQIL